MAIVSPRKYLERQIGLSERKLRNWIYQDEQEKPKRAIFHPVAEEIEKFLKGENKKNVILIPGLRGVGKTTLLFQLYDEFKDQFEKERILYLTCDDLESFGLDLMEVLDAFERFYLQENLEALSRKDKVLVFLDEAHYQKKWAQKIKSYSDRSEGLMFIVTGSSALSLEITSDLARRKHEFDMYPLSFPEYLRIKKLAKSEQTMPPPSSEAGELKEAFFSNMKPEQRKEKFKKSVSALRTGYLSDITPWEPKLENFLLFGGFPFCLNQDKFETYREVLEICERISKEDLPLVSSVGRNGKVARSGLTTLQLIADNSTFSLRRIAESIGNISRESISNLFQGYEKAGLIQILKPFGSAKKTTRKANEYYFASPTVQAAFWERVSALTKDSEQLGKLWETHVANSLIRIKSNLKFNHDLFYNYNEGGADFIVQFQNGDLVAVEVGWGSKDLRQVINTLNRVNGEYGLVISDQPEDWREVETEQGTSNLYFLPKEVFMLL